MATIRILLGILCLIASGSNLVFKRNCINGQWPADLANITALNREYRPPQIINLSKSGDAATRLLNIAAKEIGVREKTGNNDGIAVEQYLRYVKLGKGYAWCAAFISWIFGQAGYAEPRTAWSPALFPNSRLSKTVSTGQVYGIYFSSYGRIAHCGLVEKKDGDYIIGIEGNTSVSGSREGDGVYRKRRHIKTIKSFASWLPGKETEP
ncbi:peptidoglycan-binding protein [Pedobacter sp. AW1-32]|uniref:peptidoglycan-binding protein n=1 Tax=Pedobacter sp. AW1-32 TaxID=3383026 RepID=UPI003FEF4943